MNKYKGWERVLYVALGALMLFGDIVEMIKEGPR